ncbi:uncharacterized protein LOC100905890 [Galendromus occidentalis]|uniref:Uncharacterized protein LOC100905890 n=1 Tax=Galendromus occidentalis TaxID=34638 RepID=A0AAJ6VUQ0_9ACAR|nr:uncharacterized protein LOC100905890 [Galendromus occidentalis]
MSFQTQECFKARFEQNDGLFTTEEDLNRARSDCMKCSSVTFSNLQQALNTFKVREAKALDLSAKVEAGMRYLLDDGDLLADHESARWNCGMSQMRYESLLLNGDLAAKQKIDACTFRNSVRGKWYVEKQRLIRESVIEVAQSLRDRPMLLKDLRIVFALHLNSTALDKYIDCTARNLDLSVQGPFHDGSIQVDCSVSGPSKSAGGNSCVARALQARNAEEVEAMVDDIFNEKKQGSAVFGSFAKFVNVRKQRKNQIDVSEGYTIMIAPELLR